MMMQREDVERLARRLETRNPYLHPVQLAVDQIGAGDTVVLLGQGDYPTAARLGEMVREDGNAAAAALRALLDRAEKAEAERDALQGQLNDLRNGWANSVKAHAALLAERDAAFAAGLEAAAEAVLYLCRMKGMGNRTIDGPEAAHLIRALPLKDKPE